MRILSIGEVLWDVIEQIEHLGGAPLNFAAQAQKLGHEVYLVSAVGDDERGHRAMGVLRQRGICTDFVRILPDKPNGTAEVELDLDGKPTFAITRPAAYDFINLTEADLTKLRKLQPQWISYGTLYHSSQQALALTAKLLEALPSARRFYDINIRQDNWNLSAVEQLSARATVVKLNDSEAEFLDASFDADADVDAVEGFCRRWIDRFSCEMVCVTLGERGCAMLKDGEFTKVPGFHIEVADTVGAGDAFSAAFVHGLSQGWNAREIGRFANAAGAVVAGKPGAIPEWSIEEVRQLMRAQKE